MTQLIRGKNVYSSLMRSIINVFVYCNAIFVIYYLDVVNSTTVDAAVMVTISPRSRSARVAAQSDSSQPLHPHDQRHKSHPIKVRYYWWSQAWPSSYWNLLCHGILKSIRLFKIFLRYDSNSFLSLRLEVMLIINYLQNCKSTIARNVSTFFSPLIHSR